jgi:molybdate transport system substrate-binding protein
MSFRVMSFRVMRFRLLPVLALLAALVAAQPAPAQDANTLTVFAAASLRNALDDFNAQYTKATGVKVNASYAATSALAKQLESGAPADVFISADIKWMDYTVEHKLVNAGTRVNLLGNELVMIAPKDSKLDKVNIAKGFDIARLAGDGRIAVADVKAVPAGRYAKAALESLGVFDKAEPKLAQAENVRAALAYVSRGETAIGIVYATDAKADPSVKVIGAFPEGSYPPVTYPVAATPAAKPAAAGYLEMLRSRAARATFEKYGFSYLIKPTT